MLKIITAIFLFGIINSDPIDCNSKFLSSFGFSGNDKAAPRKSLLCDGMKYSCCVLTDEVKYQRTWTQYFNKKFERMYTQFSDLLEKLDPLIPFYTTFIVDENVSLFPPANIARAKILVSQISKLELKRFSDVKKELATVQQYDLQVKEKFPCFVCDVKTHLAISPLDRKVYFSPSFCNNLISNYRPYLNSKMKMDIMIALIEQLNGLFKTKNQIMIPDMVAVKDIWNFGQALKFCNAVSEFDIERCQRVCSYYKIDSISQNFIGHFSLYSNQLKKYKIVQSLIKQQDKISQNIKVASQAAAAAVAVAAAAATPKKRSLFSRGSGRSSNYSPRRLRNRRRYQFKLRILTEKGKQNKNVMLKKLHLIDKNLKNYKTIVKKIKNKNQKMISKIFRLNKKISRKLNSKKLKNSSGLIPVSYLNQPLNNNYPPVSYQSSVNLLQPQPPFLNPNLYFAGNNYHNFGQFSHFQKNSDKQNEKHYYKSKKNRQSYKRKLQKKATNSNQNTGSSDTVSGPKIAVQTNSNAISLSSGTQSNNLPVINSNQAGSVTGNIPINNPPVVNSRQAGAVTGNIPINNSPNINSRQPGPISGVTTTNNQNVINPNQAGSVSNNIPINNPSVVNSQIRAGSVSNNIPINNPSVVNSQIRAGSVSASGIQKSTSVTVSGIASPVSGSALLSPTVFPKILLPSDFKTPSAFASALNLNNDDVVKFVLEQNNMNLARNSYSSSNSRLSDVYIENGNDLFEGAFLKSYNLGFQMNGLTYDYSVTMYLSATKSALLNETDRLMEISPFKFQLPMSSQTTPLVMQKLNQFGINDFFSFGYNCFIVSGNSEIGNEKTPNEEKLNYKANLGILLDAFSPKMPLAEVKQAVDVKTVTPAIDAKATATTNKARRLFGKNSKMIKRINV